MTARQIRRAQEHKARKLARKTAAPNQSTNPPAEASAPLDHRTGQNTAVQPSLSEAKLQANRSNAKLSTGPRTAEGKAISSRNHLSHGFHGAFCVLPSENGELFTELCDNLLAEHAPATATERLLVVDMARHYWLTQRALRLQEACFQLDLDDREMEKEARPLHPLSNHQPARLPPLPGRPLETPTIAPRRSGWVRIAKRGAVPESSLPQTRNCPRKRSRLHSPRWLRTAKPRKSQPNPSEPGSVSDLIGCEPQNAKDGPTEPSREASATPFWFRIAKKFKPAHKTTSQCRRTQSCNSTQLASNRETSRAHPPKTTEMPIITNTPIRAGKRERPHFGFEPQNRSSPPTRQHRHAGEHSHAIRPIWLRTAKRPGPTTQNQ